MEIEMDMNEHIDKGDLERELEKLEEKIDIALKDALKSVSEEWGKRIEDNSKNTQKEIGALKKEIDTLKGSQLVVETGEYKVKEPAIIPGTKRNDEIEYQTAFKTTPKLMVALKNLDIETGNHVVRGEIVITEQDKTGFSFQIKNWGSKSGVFKPKIYNRTSFTWMAVGVKSLVRS